MFAHIHKKSVALYPIHRSSSAGQVGHATEVKQQELVHTNHSMMLQEIKAHLTWTAGLLPSNHSMMMEG